MRIDKIRYWAVVCGLLLTLPACRQSTAEFTVTGIVAGADGQTMYIENIGLSEIQLIDSVKLNSSGKFTFKIEQPKYPDFYRLRLKKQWINFAIDSTETVTFTADAATFATSYTVEGSENCIAIKEITLAQLDADQEVNRIRSEYRSGVLSDTAYRRRTLDMAEAYKEVARKHIYANPMSTAAYYALFQQVDGLLFFDLYDKADSRSFGAVATSYNHLYPESPRAKHLYNLALQSLKVIRSRQTLDLNQMETKEIDMLDIDLPDLRGVAVKLSDTAKDKVTILNFTAYETEWAPSLNLTLGSLYEKYHARGLEIYQVSLDTDLHHWKNVASNMGWTCVRDPQSVYSQAAALYNVKQLPAIFLLNRRGILVKRVDDLDALEKEIEALL